MLQRAGNLAHAAAGVVRQAANTGRVLVSKDVVDLRKSICLDCTEFFNHGTAMCDHPKCGCFIRAKTWLVAEKCPAGKW